MSQSDSNGYDYSEEAFAGHIGMSRDIARLHRKQSLREGVDWAKKNGQIALTRPALKKLWRRLHGAPSTLDLSACRLPNGSQKDPGTPLLALPERISYARPATLRVKKLNPNPRTLIATDQTQRDWTVLVGNNANFVRGMELPAYPSPSTPGAYQLVGKLPRRRGRWT